MSKNDCEAPECLTAQHVRVLAAEIANRVELLEARLVGGRECEEGKEKKAAHGRTGILFVDIADDLFAIRNHLLAIESGVVEIEKGAKCLEPKPPKPDGDAPARR